MKHEQNSDIKQAEILALKQLQQDNPDCVVTLGRYGEAVVTPKSRLVGLYDSAMLRLELSQLSLE